MITAKPGHFTEILFVVPEQPLISGKEHLLPSIRMRSPTTIARCSQWARGRRHLHIKWVTACEFIGKFSPDLFSIAKLLHWPCCKRITALSFSPILIGHHVPLHRTVSDAPICRVLAKISLLVFDARFHCKKLHHGVSFRTLLLLWVDVGMQSPQRHRSEQFPHLLWRTGTANSRFAGLHLLSLLSFFVDVRGM